MDLLELMCTDGSIYHADIKFLLCEEGHTYFNIRDTPLLGANEIPRDTKLYMYCKVIPSHPSRESPHIFQGGRSCLNTYHKLDLLTQAFPELPAGIQGSETKDWGRSYTLPHS